MAVFLFYIVNDALHANPMPFPGSDRNTVGKDGRRIGGIFFQHQQMPGAFKDRQVNTAVLAGLLPDGMHGIFQNVGKNGAEGYFRTWIEKDPNIELMWVDKYGHVLLIWDENLINFTKQRPARTNPENNFQLRRAGLCVSAGQGKIAIKQTEFTKEREEETCLSIYFSRLPSMV